MFSFLDYCVVTLYIWASYISEVKYLIYIRIVKINFEE